MPPSAAHRPPLALDRLGWRQFDDLCASLLELDGGVQAARWRGDEPGERYVQVQGGLRLVGVAALREPCHVQTLWVPPLAGEDRTWNLQEVFADVHRQIAGDEGTVVLLSNVDAVDEQSGPRQVTLLGPAWISDRIDALPTLRRALPSLLSLGSLRRWIADELRERSTLDLTSARLLASVFVPTGAYRRSLAALQQHHFAVLTGPPEMGKTAIARMIGLALMSEGWEAHECSTPEQLLAAHAPDRRQVFVADDAFGSTEYRPDSAERWARAMEQLLRTTDDRHWLIWTSRPAPLHAGLRRIHRERGAERFPRPGAVLVDAAALSLDERALIVLRHGQAAAAPDVRRRLRQAGYEIVDHPHFTPERVRRLVGTQTALAPQDPDQRATGIDAQLRCPTEAMAASFRALDDEHRALLIALLDAPPGPVDHTALAHLARRHHPEGLSAAPTELIDRLTDHFLRVTDSLKVDWVHPSWRDLVIEQLRGDTAARGLFLARGTHEAILLALSRDGGSGGERTLALLVCDRDWDLVTDRALELSAESSEHDVTGLLLALARAMEAEHGGPRQRRPERAELQALGSATLAAVSRRARRLARPVDVDLLGAWFALARWVATELPAPEASEAPGLALTWTELLPSVDADLTRPRELDGALAWLELAELLRVHAPDRLREFGFPAAHHDRIASLAGGAERLLTAGRVGALRPRLGQLLGRCRTLVSPSRPELASFDGLIEAATAVGDEAVSALAGGESRARRHVGLILKDL